MEMMVANSNALPLASAGKTASSTGKADGSTNPFGNLLQAVSDSSGKDDKDSKQATDPLLTLLMALSGGLSPTMLTQMNAANINTDGMSEAGPVLQVNLGGQNLSLALSALHLTNGQFAELLQKFGVGQTLVAQLLAQPQEQPARLLAAHPELLNDLTQSLDQVLNQALIQATQTTANNLPAVVVQDPQVADLMQSVLAALTVYRAPKEMTQPEQQVAMVASKQPTALGKLQATFSVHALQVTTNTAQNPVTNKAADKTVAVPQAIVQTTTQSVILDQPGTSTLQNGNDDHKQQPLANTQPIMTMNNMPVSLPLQMQMQNVQSNGTQSAPVVMIQANNFQNEFQDLLVKRAALIESPGRQEFRIVLQPQGLGEIEVRVQAVNNQISLHFAADSAQAKGMLDSGLSGLKNQLQEQGIRFDRIEVTSTFSSGGFSSGLQQESGSNQNFQGQSGGQSSKQSSAEPFKIDSLQETAAGQVTESQALDGIDVIA